MNKKQLMLFLKRKGFTINDFSEEKEAILINISKDYSKGFNIEFNGNINLLVKINKNFLDNFTNYISII